MFDEVNEELQQNRRIFSYLESLKQSWLDILFDQEFKGDIYMRQFWKDPRLAYGDKNWTLTLQGDILKMLWFPDTYVENSKKTTIHEDTKTVIVFGDGNVFYSVR